MKREITALIRFMPLAGDPAPAAMRRFSFPLLTLAIFAFAQTTRGAAGDLDPLFGHGGIVRTDFSTTEDYGAAVALQPDGKILVAGQSGIYPLFHSALTRYTKSGALDRTFGNNGKAVAVLDNRGDGIAAIAVQPDGKIVTAGYVIQNNSILALLAARFNADGTVDRTFGSNGIVETTFGKPTARGNDVVLQPDGKIVIVGSAGAGDYSDLNDFALLRLNPDGRFDLSFGNNGKVLTHFPGQFNTGSRARAAAVQADGKVVAGGTYKNEGTVEQFAMARYDTNGHLDVSFGNRGKVIGNDGTALALAIRPDGRILLAGYSALYRGNDFTLASYGANGAIDSSFGKGGVVTTDFGSGTDDIAFAVSVQSDGKLVLGGHTGAYPHLKFGLVRYTSGGQLDQSFGTSGKVVTDFADSASGYALTIQRNGKIVLAGAAHNGVDFDFAVARYFGQ